MQRSLYEVTCFNTRFHALIMFMKEITLSRSVRRYYSNPHGGDNVPITIFRTPIECTKYRNLEDLLNTTDSLSKLRIMTHTYI